MKIDLTLIAPEARQAARRLEDAGGKAYLVGGSVVDLLQGRRPKDWDIEVFGLDYGQIACLFEDQPCREVGRSFGILKLTFNGVELDVNVPRRDNKVGLGHAGFISEIDPTMTLVEAARRRDFTINALSISFGTGSVVDPFRGLDDLADGVLRATDPVYFIEDPLRGLRAMQLLARKAKTVEPRTLLLIRQMIDEFDHLPPDRILEEWRKLLLKSATPSTGLRFLLDTGWIEKFPELANLIGCGQSPKWHPEGDVWTHTLLAVDAAADLLPHLETADREPVIFSVLLHDTGKPKTTVTPDQVARGVAIEADLWTARGHDKVGMEIADQFLQRLTGRDGDKEFRKRIVRLVGEHMQPQNLWNGAAKLGAWARLHRRLEGDGATLRQLAYVSQSDACSSGPNWGAKSLKGGTPNWTHEVSDTVLDWAKDFDKTPPVPKVQGRDLISVGLTPGPQFSVILAKCLELQDDLPESNTDQLIEKALNIINQ